MKDLNNVLLICLAVYKAATDQHIEKAENLNYTVIHLRKRYPLSSVSVKRKERLRTVLRNRFRSAQFDVYNIDKRKKNLE